MEVKDVTNSHTAVDAPHDGSVKSAAPVVGQNSSAVPESESVKISIEVSSAAHENVEFRAKANFAISAINVASDATSDIEKLVKSVDGIVEQVSTQEVSPQRRQILEKEANQLVSEIKARAEVTIDNGVKPLAGDKIVTDLEKELGRTLDILLPEGAAEAFGIGTVSFSKKESIIQTRATVALARQRIETLRQAIDSSKSAVQDIVSKTEVAHQNSEASKVSIRDVDEAAAVAGGTHQEITKDPEGALGSVGSFGHDAAGLLR